MLYEYFACSMLKAFNIYADSCFFIFPFFFFDAAMELALSLEKLVNEKLLNVHSVMPLSLCFWIETLFFSCNKNFCYLYIHIEIKSFISLRIMFHEYNRWLIITMILNWQTSLRVSFR